MDPLLTTMQLGRVLTSARKAAGLTQSAVGARLGLSQKRISAIEGDPGSLTAGQLLRFCAVLGLALSIGPAGRESPAPTRPAVKKVEW